MFSIELLGSNFLENFCSQLLHLFDKFRSQFLVCHPLQALELTFLFDRSDQSGAVSIWEDLLDQPPDTILVVN